MWTCAGVVALAACVAAVTRDQFYPHGPGFDQTLPRGSVVPGVEVQLKVPVWFYREQYESIFINNYGVLTFRADIPQFLNIEFPLPYPSIAAFYSNIDTTRSGAVYYRETNEPHILSKAEESVQNNFHDCYDFKPTSVFIATWLEVPYEAPNKQPSNQRNSFQIAIISNGTESFTELLYPEREIQWIQKETSAVSLPEAKAQAGFVSEDGRMYMLRGSGSQQIRNIVVWTNTQEPGKYVFRIGNIPPEGNVALPDQYNQYEVEFEEETKTCAQSGPSVCHVAAKCKDFQAGICCKCNEGFYGNGKSCIKNDVPLRVHGKINGVLNHVNLNDVDIQAYVDVGDGRAYTALSLVPGELGNSMQLLSVLGGVIGWLFAKPAGSAKNGYQLTGSSFNHSAEIWFPATGDRVTINQEYLGHDVFDQITLEAEVRGSIPIVMANTALELTEYEEQYTLVEPGLIRSESNRSYTNKHTGRRIDQTVTQTFSFNPCRFAPVKPEDNAPVTLRISKNYLAYEARDNIVRYGMSNKIFPLGQEDPCIRGRSTCGVHSTCVAQGDSFTCVCSSGFTNIYQGNTVNCIDIDECEAGTHNCDSNAECSNYDGGFQCRCRSGFIGNGISCKALSSCRSINCDINANCVEDANGEARCVCNDGYDGNGQSCYPNYESICTRCSPFSSCLFAGGAGYVCKCRDGFIGDGYTCEQSEVPGDNYPNPGEETNEADYNDTFVLPSCEGSVCTCPNGYSEYRDKSNNQLCRSDAAPSESPYYIPTQAYDPPQPDDSQTTDYRYPPYTETNYPRYPYDTQTADPRYPVETTTSRDWSYPQSLTGNSFSTPRYDNGQPSENSYFDPSNYEDPPPAGGPGYGYPRPDSSENNNQFPDDNRPSENNYYPNSSEQNYGDNVTSDNEDPLISCDDDIDCPPNAVCSFLSPDGSGEWGGKHCVCPEGYEGDAYECIERSGPTCSCGLNAHCINTRAEEQICVCDSGFRGDGYVCRPNFICKDNSDCEKNAECKPAAGSQENICQCMQGFVKDQSDACIPDAQLCNGGWCAEHASCLYDPDLDVNYCHCDEGYTGNGIAECIPVGRTCDVTNDCSANGICTFVGDTYACVCKDGFIGDGYNCAPEATCRNDPNMCDPHASCLKRHGVYVCECNAGYNGDGSRCELNPRQAGNFLVASDGASIYRVPFRMTPRDFATPFNSGISQIAVGIDVDCEAGMIYWGDVVSFAIKSAAYDGSNFNLFLADGVKTPEGIAIDWSARNIFWTDSKKFTIEVANLDTKARKVLFALDRNTNPRGIAVHPQRGKIFWSDWKRSEPKIEWANMDGSQRGIFLDQADVALPNSLAIDWARERLCYADAGLNSIKCVNIDTREKETVASNCSYPFGLTINGNRYYWTDWRTLKIEYIDVVTKERGQVPIHTASRRLYGIAVAHDQCPPANSICGYRNGNCGADQLCLPNGSGSRTCVDADMALTRR